MIWVSIIDKPSNDTSSAEHQILSHAPLLRPDSPLSLNRNATRGHEEDDPHVNIYILSPRRLHTRPVNARYAISLPGQFDYCAAPCKKRGVVNHLISREEFLETLREDVSQSSEEDPWPRWDGCGSIFDSTLSTFFLSVFSPSLRCTRDWKESSHVTLPN